LSKLGDNIRCLRKAYGETQEELGFALGVEKNTISSYETGRTEPGKEMLSSIAKHYLVSVEELLFTDLSYMGKINFKEDDKYIIFKKISKFFPCIWTETAMENEHFKKACEKHKHFIEVSEKNCEFEVDALFACIKEYEEAYLTEVSREEAAANFVGLCFLFILILKMTPKMVNDRPAVIAKLASLDSELNDALENIDSNYEKDSLEFKELFYDQEMKKKMQEMKIVIKKSRTLCELADYYVALEYFSGIIENELEYEFNQRIGMEMLKAFTAIGNRYARQLLTLLTIR